MRVMLFDTETTGLLLPDGASLDKQPKIHVLYKWLANGGRDKEEV